MPSIFQQERGSSGDGAERLELLKFLQTVVANHDYGALKWLLAQSPADHLTRQDLVDTLFGSFSGDLDAALLRGLVQEREVLGLTDERALAGLAECALRLEMPGAAIPTFERRVASGLVTVAQAMIFVRLLAADGQHDRAAATLDMIERQHREQPFVLVEIGRTQYLINRAAEALATFARAAALRPEHPGLALHIASTLVDLGRVQNGVRAFLDHARRRGLSPELLEGGLALFCQACASRDRIYLEREVFELRDLLLGPPLAYEAGHAANLGEAIQTLLLLGDQAEALQLARLAISAAGGDRGALRALCTGVSPTPVRDGLNAVFADHVAPADVAATLGGLAAGAWNGREPVRALVYLAAASGLDPENRIHDLNLGIAWLSLGDIDRAGRHFERVRRVYPYPAAQVLWPMFNGVEWPAAPFPWAAAFDRLKPPGAGWPKITVVTPSFNHGDYVEETILSVLGQGYPNLEYIVVDGGSQDGTQAVLDRYRDRFAHLIVEKDDGQADAINKGLSLASGDIITWLNSDDMFAPGALHVAALAHLTTGADVLAGMCVEHRSRRILLASRPLATDDTFNLARLSDIFGSWLKGDFFYQPEVLFTRRLLQKAAAGYLDASLHFTMDYDLWMKFARAGARVQTGSWPFALFRKHSAQKTTDLRSCLEEQAHVRSRYCPDLVPLPRHLEIAARLTRMTTGGVCYVISKRRDKIFSNAVAQEISQAGFIPGVRFEFVSSVTEVDVAQATSVIFLVHLRDEHADMEALRARGYAGLLVGWFWDNHHHVILNAEIAGHVDVIVPGHSYPSEYLKNAKAIQLQPLPLCVTQWTGHEAETFFATDRGERSDRLYGGFVNYAFAPERRELLEKLTAAMPDQDLRLIPEGATDDYFALDSRERFARWCGYKASLVLPLDGDLSQRFFDALLTGQIPIVPDDLVDVGRVIPPHLMRRLPVIRFRSGDVAAIQRAHAEAIAAFDAGGEEGVRQRRQYALRNHCFINRIEALVRELVTLSSQRMSPAP